MKSKNIEVTATVKELSDAGYSLYVEIPVAPSSKFYDAAVKVSAIQLSKAVLRGNRKDLVTVRKAYGRNGSKSATVINIPIL